MLFKEDVCRELSDDDINDLKQMFTFFEMIEGFFTDIKENEMWDKTFNRIRGLKDKLGLPDT